jgi:hypothetical protein
MAVKYKVPSRGFSTWLKGATEESDRMSSDGEAGRACKARVG